MRDFLYQVNRRRASKTVSGVDVNRLSKWSVASISQMTLQIQPDPTTLLSKVGEPISAVRLELDINNVPTPDWSFSGESAMQLFDELVELGPEISESGEVE